MRLPHVSIKFIVDWLDREQYIANRSVLIQFSHPR